MVTEQLESPTLAIAEMRRSPRFELTARVPARLNGMPLHVIDIGVGGVQIEHSSMLRLGSIVTITFDTECAFDFPVRVVWSHVMPAMNGKPNLFRSGAAFAGELDLVAGKLGLLIHGCGRRETGSLERKKAMAEARAQKKPTMRFMARPEHEVADEIRLIRDARDFLAHTPDEAVKWYSRAKFSAAESTDIASEIAYAPYRQEVLAVWEYLGRRIALQRIVRVFEGQLL